MGKQGKRRRRRRERNRGIAPQALFNFALMMGAYFPCVVTIISVLRTHIHCHIPSASHSSITLLFFLLHLFSLLTLYCPSQAFPAPLNCPLPSPTTISASRVCMWAHIHANVQPTFQHRHVYIYQLLPLPTEKSTAPCKLANTAIIYTFFFLIFLKISHPFYPPVLSSLYAQR